MLLNQVELRVKEPIRAAFISDSKAAQGGTSRLKRPRKCRWVDWRECWQPSRPLGRRHQASDCVGIAPAIALVTSPPAWRLRPHLKLLACRTFGYLGLLDGRTRRDYGRTLGKPLTMKVLAKAASIAPRVKQTCGNLPSSEIRGLDYS
jgi:hypothetical protein